MKILIVAPPVAPLGDGKTGGITLHITNTVHGMQMFGHEATVLAPCGSSVPNCEVREVEGTPQPTLARPEDHEIYPIPTDPLVGRLWQEAHKLQSQFDVVLNFSHDWLPYYLTEFFEPPLCHVVNMSDVNGATSHEIARVQRKYPFRVGFMTEAQARRLPGVEAPLVISFGIDLAKYTFQGSPSEPLVWAGRISREKGLEDALQIAKASTVPLMIAGAIDDDAYWRELKDQFDETIDYRGFLGTEGLQAVLGSARALLQTQRWHEAFGIVTTESMACGTPVIAYNQGANSELIVDGETGFLVPQGDIDAAVGLFQRIGNIPRRACRERAEDKFGLAVYAQTIDRWLRSAVSQ